MANNITVSVIGDVKDINRKLGNVDKQLEGFGKQASNMGRALAGAFAAVGAITVFKDIVTGASNAQQSLGATEAVFGKYADTVTRTSNEAATKFGLSANEYRENANILGAVLGNLGVSQEELAGKSEGLIKVGSDLAATFGGTTKSAVEALTAAYKGEYEQLERYGVSIKAADVATELAARGQNKLTGAAKKAAEQQVVSDLIAKQSAKSTGAFAKESDTLANKQQILAAKVQNLKDNLGSQLLPVLTTIAGYITDSVLPALQDFGRWLQDNSAWLTPIAVGLTAIATAIGIWTAVTWLATAAQAALAAVMALNPFVIIALAIIGLIAALVYLWKTNEGFRDAVKKVWAAIKSAVGSVIDWFKTDVPAAWNTVKAKTTAAWNAIKSFFTQVWKAIVLIATAQPRLIIAIVTGAWDKVKSATTAAWNAVKSGISKVWDGIKSGVKNGINAVNSTVAGLRGKVIGIFSSAGTWLINAGRKILDGLVSGINRGIDKVRGILQKVTGLIPDWKGPADKDATLLFDAGTLIMEGLMNGIDSQTRNLKRTLGKVTDVVAGTDVGMVSGGAIAMDVNSLRGSLSASNSGNHYSITVNALDPQSASRAVVESLREYERMNGRLY